MTIRQDTLTLSSRPEVRWTGNSHFVISTGMERADIHQKQISRLRTVSSARNDIQRQFYGYIACNTVRDGKDILPMLNYSRIGNGSARKRKTLAGGCIFFSFLKFFHFFNVSSMKRT